MKTFLIATTVLSFCFALSWGSSFDSVWLDGLARLGHAIKYAIGNWVFWRWVIESLRRGREYE